MPARIDWTGLRKQSEDIPDFINQLFAAIRKHPEGQRAALLFDVLDDISPALKPKVQRETEILVRRGAPPAKALQLATLVTLKNRRRRLFHWVFFTKFPKTVKDFVKTLEGMSSDDERAQALVNFVNACSNTEFKPYDQKQALIRLRETGFPEAFIQEAKDLKRRTTEQVLNEIKARVASGEKERLVIQDELEKTLFEYGLSYMMGQGVAKGPDFCFVAAALAITAVSITIAAVVSTSLVSEVEARKVERKIKDAQKIAEKELEAADVTSSIVAENQDLTEEELRRIALAAVGVEDFAEARQGLIDVLRNTRNRTTPKARELSRFRALWGKMRLEAAVAMGTEQATQAIATAYADQQTELAATKKRNLAITVVAGLAVAGGLGYVSRRKP